MPDGSELSGVPTGYGVFGVGAAGAAVIASGKVVVVLEGGTLVVGVVGSGDGA